jgi:hypothetical protein
VHKSLSRAKLIDFLYTAPAINLSKWRVKPKREWMIFLFVTILFTSSSHADGCAELYRGIYEGQLRVQYEKKFLAGDMNVQALEDKNESIYLFRVLGGKFQKNAQTIWQDDENKMVSYSLSPHIVEDWWATKNGIGEYVVVAHPNLKEDGLTYWTPRPDRLFVNGKSVYQTPLKRTTTMDEIGILLYEVQIPKDRELPLFQISKDNFRRVIESFDNHSFSMKELIEKITSSGLAEPFEQ